jgi:hypothetical protein
MKGVTRAPGPGSGVQMNLDTSPKASRPRVTPLTRADQVQPGDSSLLGDELAGMGMARVRRVVRGEGGESGARDDGVVTVEEGWRS